MKKKIFISTHAVFANNGEPLYGSGSGVEKFLSEKKINYEIIKFPIVGNHKYIKETHDGKKLTKDIFTHPSLNFLPIRSANEFFNLFKKGPNGKNIVFIGIDPLNALYGIILKKMGRVDKVIFYTADYAHKRFENPILNASYHLIDRIAAKSSDYVWNVSTRIFELRKKHGVKKEKNKFIPNSPHFDEEKILPLNKIDRNRLILVSSSPTSTNIPIILKAVKKIAEKNKKIGLTIVGMSDWKKNFEKIVIDSKAQKYVDFHFNMEHDQLLDLMRKSGVGVALYTNQSTWTYFSDPMKVRDYLSAGLPVIITKAVGTADEIERNKAGIAVEMDANEITSAINKIINNNEEYAKFRKNALKIAKGNDMRKNLEKNLMPLLR